jgi:hypothetical protein
MEINQGETKMETRQATKAETDAIMGLVLQAKDNRNPEEIIEFVKWYMTEKGISL